MGSFLSEIKGSDIYKYIKSFKDLGYLTIKNMSTNDLEKLINTRKDFGISIDWFNQSVFYNQNSTDEFLYGDIIKNIDLLVRYGKLKISYSAADTLNNFFNKHQVDGCETLKKLVEMVLNKKIINTQEKIQESETQKITTKKHLKETAKEEVYKLFDEVCAKYE